MLHILTMVLLLNVNLAMERGLGSGGSGKLAAGN
jgi:hypothetical protein